MKNLKTLGIVGLGLLGSSLAATIKSKDSKIKICGISSPKSLSIATENGLIDFAFSYNDIDTVLNQCDILVICTPIQHILSLLNKWKTTPLKTNHHCLILDVGSTKEIICKEASSSFRLSPNIIFIGSHPMAGSEHNGIESCDPILYENIPWILSANSDTKPHSLQQAKDFIALVGAYSFEIDPVIHDQLVSQFSHVPQLIATGLAYSISQKSSKTLEGLTIAGEGFNSMTRLAQSPFHIWKDIFATNSNNIEKHLDHMIETLIHIRSNIKNQNLEHLEQVFKTSQNIREKYAKKNQRFNPYNGELIIRIEDKPGALQLILSYLERQSLNITNIHLLTVKEQESGNLLISFKQKKEAQKALGVLINKGYFAYLR